jgi:hypothetical protein
MEGFDADSDLEVAVTSLDEGSKAFPFCQGVEAFLVGGAHAPPMDLRELALDEAVSMVQDTVATLSRPERLAFGAALLLCHVQDNWTGPPLGPALSFATESANTAALRHLGVSGERAQPTLRSPLLLVLARQIFCAPDAPRTHCWLRWKARALSRHRHALGGALAGEIENEERGVWEALEVGQDEERLVERAVWLCETGRYSDAMALVQGGVQGATALLTGRMGRRTRYQTFDVPQVKCW